MERWLEGEPPPNEPRAGHLLGSWVDLVIEDLEVGLEGCHLPRLHVKVRVEHAAGVWDSTRRHCWTAREEFDGDPSGPSGRNLVWQGERRLALLPGELIEQTLSPAFYDVLYLKGSVAHYE